MNLRELPTNYEKRKITVCSSEMTNGLLLNADDHFDLKYFAQ